MDLDVSLPPLTTGGVRELTRQALALDTYSLNHLDLKTQAFVEEKPVLNDLFLKKGYVLSLIISSCLFKTRLQHLSCKNKP